MQELWTDGEKPERSHCRLLIQEPIFEVHPTDGWVRMSPEVDLHISALVNADVCNYLSLHELALIAHLA